MHSIVLGSVQNSTQPVNMNFERWPYHTNLPCATPVPRTRSPRPSPTLSFPAPVLHARLPRRHSPRPSHRSWHLPPQVAGNPRDGCGSAPGRRQVASSQPAHVPVGTRGCDPHGLPQPVTKANASHNSARPTQTPANTHATASDRVLPRHRCLH